MDSLTFLYQLLRLRFRKLRVLVAFEGMVDMCQDQDSDLFNMMPVVQLLLLFGYLMYGWLSDSGTSYYCTFGNIKI